MMSAEGEFGTRAGHIQYFRDCSASFGTSVGNYVLYTYLIASPLHIVSILCQQSNYSFVLIARRDSYIVARLTIVQLGESLSTSILPLSPSIATPHVVELTMIEDDSVSPGSSIL